MSNLKKIAVDFLQLVVAGKINEAYEKYVDMNGKHHNAFFPAGFAALKKAMEDNEAQFPNKKLEVEHVLEEDDLVAVHSHLMMGEKNLVVVHMFRFEDDKIVELWDCGQEIAADCPNKDGAF